jgi:hypothetical protein
MGQIGAPAAGADGGGESAVGTEARSAREGAWPAAGAP